MTEGTPYCQIHGYDFSSIVYAEGVEPSGGAVGVEEVLYPDRNYADVRSKGRAPKKYKVRARSVDRDEIEAFLGEVNSAPIDSEFYPFEAGRSARIASAYASLKPAKQWGNGKIFYEADAEIICRESWLYGPDEGIPFTNVPFSAVSGIIRNDGHERAPINYLLVGGGSGYGNYVADLSVRITPDSSSAEHDRELDLCDCMLTGDRFELGWRGEIIHCYESNFNTVDNDLWEWGSGNFDVTDDLLTIFYAIRIGSTNAAWLWIPFSGPHPVCGESGSLVLELWVEAIAGFPAIIATTDWTSHMATIIDADDLVVGYNRIVIPGYEGTGNVAIGLWCQATGDSITLSKFKGTVKRYVAPSKIPWSDPGENFKIRVEASVGCQLGVLQIVHNDRYWY